MTLQECIEKLKKNTLNHAYFNKTAIELLSIVKEAIPGEIVLLYGPTGVGKTRILQQLNKLLTLRLKQDEEFREGDMPVVRVEVSPGNEQRPFSWKEYYHDTLEVLLGQNPEKKYIDARGKEFHFDRGLHLSYYTTEVELKKAVKKALAMRNVKVLMIDEAHHIASSKTKLAILKQLDYIKSKANTFQPVLVLAGTYDLIPYRNKSGQLSRRSRNVHFPRYNRTKDAEFKQFISVLKIYQKLLPEGSVTLTDYPDRLYCGCVGCIGILHTWIYRACINALEAEQDRVLLKNLEKGSFGTDQLIQMAEEIASGEAVIREQNGSFDKLARILDSGALYHAICPDSKTSEKESGTKSKRGTSKPGQRKPHRDKVGEESHV